MAAVSDHRRQPEATARWRQSGASCVFRPCARRAHRALPPVCDLPGRRLDGSRAHPIRRTHAGVEQRPLADPMPDARRPAGRHPRRCRIRDGRVSGPGGDGRADARAAGARRPAAGSDPHRRDNHWIALPDGLLKDGDRIRAASGSAPPDVLQARCRRPVDRSRHGGRRHAGCPARTYGSCATATPGLQSAGAQDAARDLRSKVPRAKRWFRSPSGPSRWISTRSGSAVFGMETQYLPMPVLRALARSDTGPESEGLYRTRLQVLYGEALLPGAMALLAASLSMLLLAYATPLRGLWSASCLPAIGAFRHQSVPADGTKRLYAARYGGLARAGRPFRRVDSRSSGVIERQRRGARGRDAPAILNAE